MNALKLPETVRCPVCAAELERVSVLPVIDGQTLEAVRVVCPNCAAARDIRVEEMARYLAQKILGPGSYDR